MISCLYNILKPTYANTTKPNNFFPLIFIMWWSEKLPEEIQITFPTEMSNCIFATLFILLQNVLQRLNWLKPCDRSSSAAAAVPRVPGGMGDFPFRPRDGYRGTQHHSLAVAASEVLQNPPPCHPLNPATWGISGLRRWLPVLVVLWSRAGCDIKLSDVVKNPAKALELRGQRHTTGAAGFIFCASATVELWFLWNTACIGRDRVKTPRELLSSMFKATSDCLGSRQLNNQNFFYSLGSKSLVLSSCSALCW